MSTVPNTALSFRFNARAVTPQAPMEAIPAGWYPVAIVGGEVVFPDAERERMNLEFQVLDGPMKGRKVFDGLNIRNPSAQAMQISAGQLSAICHAIQVYEFQQLGELFNKPFQLRVDVQPGRFVDSENNEVAEGTPGAKYYEPKNRMKDIKAADGSQPGKPATGAPPAGAMPAWGAPAQPAAATQPATAAAPAKGKPGRKPKVQPAAAGVAVGVRRFFVDIDQPAFADAIPEATIAQYLAQGMPATTEMCLEGTDEYKPASAWNIGQPVAVAQQAFVAPVQPAAVAQPAAGGPPPWAVAK